MGGKTLNTTHFIIINFEVRAVTLILKLDVNCLHINIMRCETAETRSKTLHLCIVLNVHETVEWIEQSMIIIEL